MDVLSLLVLFGAACIMEAKSSAAGNGPSVRNDLRAMEFELGLTHEVMN